VPLYRPEGCTQFNDISRGPLLLGLRVQVGLNKGEARNSLARSTFFKRRAQIQTRVLNEDWEHTFPVTRSFINVGSPVR
jgi:hypothetical protein